MENEYSNVETDRVIDLEVNVRDFVDPTDLIAELCVVRWIKKWIRFWREVLRQWLWDVPRADVDARQASHCPRCRPHR